jgi:hypothetical protein
MERSEENRLKLDEIIAEALKRTENLPQRKMTWNLTPEQQERFDKLCAIVKKTKLYKEIIASR